MENIYELIKFAVEAGLLTIEIARELQSYFHGDSDQSQEQQVISEALMTLKEKNINSNQEKPFSDIGWLRQFMSETQKIYDIQTQEICGRILAHEFVFPGVTPQRMGQILSAITFEDMQKFQIISSMNIGIVTDYNNDSPAPDSQEHVMVPFNFSGATEYSEKFGICLDDVLELQAMGLLTYNSGGYDIRGYVCKYPLIYARGETFYILWHPKDIIPIGTIVLTKAGKCLSDAINECEIVDEYAHYVRAYMEHLGIAFAEQKRYTVCKANGHYMLTVTAKKHN